MSDDDLEAAVLLVGEAAAILNLSTSRVVQLDAELQPQRIGASRYRAYSRARVEALRDRREAVPPRPGNPSWMMPGRGGNPAGRKPRQSLPVATPATAARKRRPRSGTPS